MIHLILLTVLNAPLPFPRPCSWLPNPVGEYVIFVDGKEQSRATVRTNGTARYVYTSERSGEPFPTLTWTLDRADGWLCLKDEAGIVRIELTPDMARSFVKVRRLK